MADHAEPHPDLAGYCLGVLDAVEVDAFEQHLASCERCRAEVAELEGLSRLLDEAAPPLDIPPTLRDRTLGAVREAAAVQNRRTRRRWLAAVAAAVVLVAGGVTAGVAVTRPAPPERQIALSSVSGGPAHGVARLFATPGGTEIDMDLTDLPPNPPGTMYECWFVAPDDTLANPDRVSAGTFTVGSATTTHVRMTTAADLSKFPRMGITLEPTDGNPQRTGPKILAGQ
jgi:anti-sigma-K factor RskA